MTTKRKCAPRTKRTADKIAKEDMSNLYRSLTRGKGGAGVVNWGEGAMTYLGEGVYLKADGTMYDSDPER